MNFPRALLRLLGRRLPITSGSVAVHGIEQAVTIGRDRFGIPHIEARTELDGWFGLGFCQGQDRAFQLETRLRLVRGTLAALVGEDALPLDRLSRRIDFVGSGRRSLEALDPVAAEKLEAFAAGVRAGVSQGRGGRSHEFVLLRKKPSDFEASDALGFLAVQAFSLASNWDTELARLQMLTLDGPEAVEALHPPYRSDQPVSARPGEAAGRVVDAFADDLARARDLFTAGGGSNNWAVGASKTVSGRPILANDPHLAPILPPHWYLVRLVTPDWTVVGASTPATPGIAVGHNGSAAWGVTAGLIDNTDLFLEEVGPDGRSVRRGDGFVSCEVRREIIEVAGGDDVVIDVLETDRGPIVGPAFEGDMGALSMSATWFESRGAEAMFDFGRITSFDHLHEAFRAWTSLPLNIAYADESSIGWQLIGSAPIRGTGGGMLPLRAADPGTEWAADPVPYDEIPRVVDPGSGFVATANNLPATDGPYLGSDFLDGYRAARITEALAGRDDWDVAGMLDLQMDFTSIPWREMRDGILGAAAPAGDLGVLVDLLRDWDGRVEPDSTAATVFEVAVAELCRMIAETKAPRSSAYAVGQGFSPLVPFNTLMVRRVSHLVGLLEERPDGWFDDGWDEVIRTAMRRTRDTLIERFGPDPRTWAWGDVRRLTLSHPMGMRPPLDRIWNIGPIRHGGDANTINPSPVDPRDPLAPPAFAISSLRFVVEAGAWDLARFCLPGGQSGNPYSRHYSDQIELWASGDALVIPFGSEAARRTIREHVELIPS